MTTISADAAFTIGHSHAVCQDYASARINQNETRVRRGFTDVPGAVAFLSDGCSGSPDTDMGARLLVHAALRERVFLASSLSTGEDVSVWVGMWTNIAHKFAHQMFLPFASLDATLLGVVADDERWSAFIVGDGVLAIGRTNGATDVYAVEWGRNCPGYPAYRLDDQRRRAFEAVEGNTRTVTAFRLHGPGEPVPLAEYADILHIGGEIGDTRFVALLSDGAQSLRDADNQAVPLSDVLPLLLSFKVFAGAFVQRRLARFASECRARGWRYHDDVSVAAVAFER